MYQKYDNIQQLKLPRRAGQRLRHAHDELPEGLPRQEQHPPLPHLRGRVRHRLLQEAGLQHPHPAAQDRLQRLHQGLRRRHAHGLQTQPAHSVRRLFADITEAERGAFNCELGDKDVEEMCNCYY